MVKAKEKRLERTRNVRKVDDPARMVVDRTLDVNGYTVRVAVESRTLVPLGGIWEAVCSLEGELFEDLHFYGIPRNLCV